MNQMIMFDQNETRTLSKPKANSTIKQLEQEEEKHILDSPKSAAGLISLPFMNLILQNQNKNIGIKESSTEINPF